MKLNYSIYYFTKPTSGWVVCELTAPAESVYESPVPSIVAQQYEGFSAKLPKIKKKKVLKLSR